MMSYTRWTRVGIMVVPMSEIAVNIWFMIWLYDIDADRIASHTSMRPEPDRICAGTSYSRAFQSCASCTDAAGNDREY